MLKQYFIMASLLLFCPLSWSATVVLDFDLHNAISPSQTLDVSLHSSAMTNLSRTDEFGNTFYNLYFDDADFGYNPIIEQTNATPLTFTPTTNRLWGASARLNFSYIEFNETNSVSIDFQQFNFISSAPEIAPEADYQFTGQLIFHIVTLHYVWDTPLPTGPLSFEQYVTLLEQLSVEDFTAGFFSSTAQEDNYHCIYNGASHDCTEGVSVNFNPAYQARLTQVSSVPIPAAAWMFGSALIGLASLKRKK